MTISGKHIFELRLSYQVTGVEFLIATVPGVFVLATDCICMGTFMSEANTDAMIGSISEAYTRTDAMIELVSEAHDVKGANVGLALHL